MHGFIPPSRFFPYLTWTDVQAISNKENVVIIQPVGAIEQHGPHLPRLLMRQLVLPFWEKRWKN
ncbi:hypothetical protein NUACC26_066430 [Scytonema sp. NUACC26]